MPNKIRQAGNQLRQTHAFLLAYLISKIKIHTHDPTNKHDFISNTSTNHVRLLISMRIISSMKKIAANTIRGTARVDLF